MPQLPAKPSKPRTTPTFRTSPKGVVSIETECPDQLRRLFGTNTREAASGLIRTAMNALGRSGEDSKGEKAM